MEIINVLPRTVPGYLYAKSYVDDLQWGKKGLDLNVWIISANANSRTVNWIYSLLCHLFLWVNLYKWHYPSLGFLV